MFRFYKELNDLIPQKFRKKDFEYTFFGTPSVKDAVEAIGVPHTEVDLIIVNSRRSVDFSYRIMHGDRIAVYPVFESLDISPVIRLRPKPLGETRFLADEHLGKLARLLRLLGFDTLYEPSLSQPDMAAVSHGQKRIIITRHAAVLKRSDVTRGCLVRSALPEKQVEEIMAKFHLAGSVRPFTRCMSCNGILVQRNKQDIAHGLQPGTRKHYDHFLQCEVCGKLYWKGSHYTRLASFVEKITNLDF